jgi:glycosyltransferase involved in cell wall biosynthesis
MRVCFVSFEFPPNVLGGVGTYAEIIVEGLKRRGVDVFAITRGNQNDYGQKTFGIPTSDVRFWRRLFFMRPALSVLHRLNKLIDFDLVHFNEPHIMFGKLDLPTVCTLHSTQVNEIKLRLAGSKTLKTTHDIRDLILKGPVGTIFDVFKTHAVDKIICPSYHLVRLIRSYCLIDEQKICVVPNGMDLEAFDKIRNNNANILTKYELEKDKYILYVGRLSVLKGVQYLIEAFRVIKKDYSNLKLVIVGTGDYENYLRNIAYGLEGVVFTGYVDSILVKKALYENCVGVVVPSLYEGLPMVVLEAMASKKAVIASDVGGLQMLIKNEKNGFLTKPGDVKGIEMFIRTLLEDANLREKQGSFGRKLVEKEFNIDKMVDRTLKVYESVLTQSSR